jgi:hypothetical protein
MQLLRRRPDASWESSPDQRGVSGRFGTMAYHPRWGYVIAWHQPPQTRHLYPVAGPYVLRGSKVGPLFRERKDAPRKDASPPRRGTGGKKGANPPK